MCADIMEQSTGLVGENLHIDEMWSFTYKTETKRIDALEYSLQRELKKIEVNAGLFYNGGIVMVIYPGRSS